MEITREDRLALSLPRHNAAISVLPDSMIDEWIADYGETYTVAELRVIAARKCNWRGVEFDDVRVRHKAQKRSAWATQIADRLEAVR